MKFIHIVTIFEHHMLIKGTGVFIQVKAPIKWTSAFLITSDSIAQTSSLTFSIIIQPHILTKIFQHLCLSVGRLKTYPKAMNLLPNKNL